MFFAIAVRAGLPRGCLHGSLHHGRHGRHLQFLVALFVLPEDADCDLLPEERTALFSAGPALPRVNDGHRFSLFGGAVLAPPTQVGVELFSHLRTSAIFIPLCLCNGQIAYTAN